MFFERLVIINFVNSETVFGDWTEWSECSTECGDGERQRSRKCLNGCSNIDSSDTNEQDYCNQGDCSKYFLVRINAINFMCRIIRL